MIVPVIPFPAIGPDAASVRNTQSDLMFLSTYYASCDSTSAVIMERPLVNVFSRLNLFGYTESDRTWCSVPQCTIGVTSSPPVVMARVWRLRVWTAARHAPGGPHPFTLASSPIETTMPSACLISTRVLAVPASSEIQELWKSSR
jgi:hypothetical protein